MREWLLSLLIVVLFIIACVIVIFIIFIIPPTIVIAIIFLLPIIGLTCLVKAILF